MRRKLVVAQARSTSTARKRSKKKPTRQWARARRLMTMQDIARCYGCNEKKIRMFRRAGLLPPPCPLSSSRKYLWHPHVIERWLRSEVEPSRNNVERVANMERP